MKRWKNNLLILLWFFVGHSLFPVPRIIDSIDSILQTTSSLSSEEIKLLYYKGKELQYTKPEHAVFTFKFILQSPIKKSSLFTGQLWEDLGRTYFHLGYTDSAEWAYQQAYALFIKNNCSKCIANLALDYANIKNRFGDFASANNLCNTALEISLRIQDITLLGQAYHRLGTTYYLQKDYPNALKFFNKALNSFKGDSLIEEKLKVYNNIALVYLDMGRLQDAYDLLKKSLPIAREKKLKKIASTILNNLGRICIFQKKYDEATDHLFEALKLKNEIYEQEGLGVCHLNLGKIFLEKKQYELAEFHLENSEKLLSVSRSYTYLSETIGTLAELYEKQHQFEKALQYRRFYENLKDSLQKIQYIKLLKAAEYQYKTKELENENKVLRQQQIIERMKSNEKRKNFTIIIIFFALSLLVLAILLYIVWLQSKHQKEVQKINLNLVEKNAQLEQSKREISEAVETRDKLFRIISHDLRNPIASILSFVRIMRRDFDKLSSEEREMLLDELDRVTTNMSELLENLLLWYRTQGNRWIAQPEIISLHQALNNVLTFYEKNLISKNITVETPSQDTPAIAHADPKMVETIFRNLLSNAIKFTPKNGNIKIEFKKEDSQIIIKVQDSGVGMSKELIDKILNNHPIESTRGTEGEKGCGVGLMIVKELIEKNHGKFWIESKIGEGTAFYFSLPAAPEK